MIDGINTQNCVERAVRKWQGFTGICYSDETVDLTATCMVVLGGRDDCYMVFKPHPHVGSVMAAEVERLGGTGNMATKCTVATGNIHEPRIRGKFQPLQKPAKLIPG